MNLDKIFNHFTETSIFNSKKVLQVSYTPEVVSHREEQISQIASIMAPSLRLEKPSNLFLYGKTGTGKTLSVKYVGQQLNNKAKEKNTNVNLIYINCKLKKVADTEYRILYELIRTLGKEVPATGLPTEQLYKIFLDIVDKEEQVLIIILDEIDQAVKKIGDEFLYNFTRIDHLKKSQISLVGISNDLVFIETLDPRVRSSLGEEEIVFPPYDAIQLKDILEARSKVAFKDGIVAEGVIEKCAAYAAGEHGDARRALDLLRVAGELVERDCKSKITLEYIDKAEEKIEKEKILDITINQPKQFQLTLLSIIEKSKETNKVFYTGDIYEGYEKLCNNLRFKPLTQRRVGDIISEFDMLGLINARVISSGRYGRKREIRVTIPKNLVGKVEEALLKSLNLK
ncbi:MAG: orc1/cdc6 family replication initiation protein [Nanoarchaeota archaeon]